MNEEVKCLFSLAAFSHNDDCETSAAAAEQTAMSHFPFSLQPTKKMTTP